MEHKYLTISKTEMTRLIERAAVRAIRKEFEPKECQMANRLSGIFDLMDELIAMLNDPEVE